MKTARERADEKRVEKLQAIDEQIANGRLIVREMTDEERLKYPPNLGSPLRQPGDRRVTSSERRRALGLR
jgi:hypothetical protein